MPRLQDYEKAQVLKDDDLLLIDQEGSTKSVTVDTLKKKVGEGVLDITVELEE